MATIYYFWKLQRVGLLRGREKMVYWCMPLFLPHFPSSFSFSVFFFLLLVSNYYLAVGCSPFLVFLFPGYLSLGAYYSLTMGFPPLSTSLHWVSLFRCFFSLPLFFLFFCFFLLNFLVPFNLPCLPSFYSKMIQCDFSLLPLGLYQLFLVCCGHPFKITHSPIGCPCHCSIHVYCNATHFTTKFPFVRSCCIPLPHYLALWHASDGLNHLLLLLGKIPSHQDIFPKRSYGRKPNIDPLFPPPPNHALWIPLTVGPPPLYWLGTGW